MKLRDRVLHHPPRTPARIESAKQPPQQPREAAAGQGVVDEDSQLGRGGPLGRNLIPHRGQIPTKVRNVPQELEPSEGVLHQIPTV